MGFVKLKDGIPNIDECPECKEKWFLRYMYDKLKKKFLLNKRKEKLIYLLNLTLNFKGDQRWVVPILLEAHGWSIYMWRSVSLIIKTQGELIVSTRTYVIEIDIFE